MPATTRPARGWSNMLSTSSVWTSDPSGRFMATGSARPTRASACVRTKLSKPSANGAICASGTSSSADRPTREPRGQPMSCSAVALA